jgi:hypothetical protein
VTKSRRKKHRVAVEPPRQAVFRVEFDHNDNPVIERLSVFEGKEHFALRTESGETVYSAPYLSVRMQRTLGTSPRSALETRIAALESSASEARAELNTLERQLAAAREALAKLGGSRSE